ncbi:MAG: ATP-binding protein, partial [Thermoanaerobaculia bacterium]
MARKNDSRDPLEALRELLVRLNLTTVSKRLGELLAQAETVKPAFSEFLLRTLEVEEAARWERKIQRRVRWSKLGPPVSLEGFDWAARPQLSPQVVKELLT